MAESSGNFEDQDKDKDAQKLANLEKEIENQDGDSTEKANDDTSEKKEKPAASKASAKKAAPKKKEVPKPPAPKPKKEAAPAEVKKPAAKKMSLSTDAESVIDQVVESSYDTTPKKAESKVEE